MEQKKFIFSNRYVAFFCFIFNATKGIKWCTCLISDVLAVASLSSRVYSEWRQEATCKRHSFGRCGRRSVLTSSVNQACTRRNCSMVTSCHRNVPNVEKLRDREKTEKDRGVRTGGQKRGMSREDKDVQVIFHLGSRYHASLFHWNHSRLAFSCQFWWWLLCMPVCVTEERAAAHGVLSCISACTLSYLTQSASSTPQIRFLMWCYLNQPKQQSNKYKCVIATSGLIT